MKILMKHLLNCGDMVYHYP